MQRLMLLSILLIISAMLSGCTVLKKINERTPQNTCCKTPTKVKPEDVAVLVDKQLVALADSVDQSLHTLAAAQRAESPPILNTEPLMTPEGGMGGTVELDWTGPIAPLVEKIAKLTNYRVKLLGTEPAIPIIVTITAKHGIIAEILQNASLQAGKRAEVLVFPENRVIEVRYLS